MRLSRDDDTVQIELHAHECNRANHLAYSEDVVQRERQEDGNVYPLATREHYPACETGDDWVKVKRRLSMGDTAAIAGAGVAFRMKVNSSGRPESQSLEFGSAEFQSLSIAGLVVGIKDWSLSAALSPKNIANLQNEDAELIAQRCNELWHPPRTDDEKGNSFASSAQPSEMRSEPRPSSDG